MARDKVRDRIQIQWLDDWRDASNYEYLKNADSDQLVWELIRRDPEYVQLWHQYWQAIDSKCALHDIDYDLPPGYLNSLEQMSTNEVLLKMSKKWDFTLLPFIDPPHPSQKKIVGVEYGRAFQPSTPNLLGSAIAIHYGGSFLSKIEPTGILHPWFWTPRLLFKNGFRAIL